MPPESFEIKAHNDKLTLLSWNHRPCYESYLVTVFNSDNKTVVFNDTIQAGNPEAKFLEQDVGGLGACTEYTFTIRIITEKGQVSADHTAFVFFTDHAENLNMAAYSDYHEVVINVELHGTDCLDHYIVHLCNESSKNCREEMVTTSGNITFSDLEDGYTFNYRLTGLDQV